ncbi:MAG: hypothetical protein ACR2NZ_05170 [Rubripirellula sp.]
MEDPPKGIDGKAGEVQSVEAGIAVIGREVTPLVYRIYPQSEGIRSL